MKPNISNEGQRGQYSLRVLNPVGILRFNPLPYARRLQDLRQRKIGLYWNNKARGDVALERVKNLLSERFEGMAFEWFETPISVEATKEWFEKVKKSGVDGIVASTGD
jgi:hypothetical protein